MEVPIPIPKDKCYEGDFTLTNSIEPTDGFQGIPESAIPEFSTVAIPVAAVLGIHLFFNHRRRFRNN